MKKNTKKKLGVAAVALGLVAAVGATAGTTLAKYVSSVETKSDQATVAKWGYTVTTDATNLFGEQYNAGTILTSKVTTPTYATIDVAADSTSTHNVVAPGTKGSMTFEISGSAEVNAELVITVSDFQNIYLLKTGEGEKAYYPLKWTIGGTAVTADEDGAIDTAEILNAIKTAITTGTALTDSDVTVSATAVTVKIPANTNFDEIDLSIGWEWEFETAKDGSGNYNTEDTILGVFAEKGSYEGYTAETVVKLDLSVTVQQTTNKA